MAVLLFSVSHREIELLHAFAQGHPGIHAFNGLCRAVDEYDPVLMV